MGKVLKRFLLVQLAVVLLLGAVPLAFANQIEDPGSTTLSVAGETLSSEAIIEPHEEFDDDAGGNSAQGASLELGDPASYRDDQILVTFANDWQLDEKIDNLASSIDGLASEGLTSLEDSATTVETQVSEVIDDAQGQSIAVLDLPADVAIEDALREALRDPAVVAAQPNYIYELLEDDSSAATSSASAYNPLATPDDPYISTPFFAGTPSSTQWWLGLVKAQSAWDLAQTNHQVTIAIVDTGVHLTHPDLVANIDAVHAWDVIRNQPLATSVAQGAVGNGDISGHGTHVSGIAAAATNNGVYGAGVSYNATLLPVLVFANTATTTTAEIAEAYTYLIGLKVQGTVSNLHVINLSLGGYDNEDVDEVFHAKIRDALNQGIPTVAAGGNGHKLANGSTVYTDKGYPADWDECIAVTAVTQTKSHYISGDYNSYKDICAPGVTIYSTLYNGDLYGSKTGTSMAAPVVAGIAALLWSRNPALTVDNVKTILCNTAEDISDGLGGTGWDPYYGWGLVDARAALEEVDRMLDGYRVPGDLDGDGIVTIAGALIAAQAVIVGTDTLTPAQIDALDIDRDGFLTMADIVFIMHLAAGL